MICCSQQHAAQTDKIAGYRKRDDLTSPVGEVFVTACPTRLQHKRFMTCLALIDDLLPPLHLDGLDWMSARHPSSSPRQGDEMHSAFLPGRYRTAHWPSVGPLVIRRYSARLRSSKGLAPQPAMGVHKYHVDGVAEV